MILRMESLSACNFSAITGAKPAFCNDSLKYLDTHCPLLHLLAGNITTIMIIHSIPIRLSVPHISSGAKEYPP